jgi:hypothetical protein
VVLASVADVKLAEVFDKLNRARQNHQFASDGDKKEFVTGESAEETVKTIRVRECRVNLTDLW